eukprot:3252706-Alexandrium_andersonii.AAC.1
MRKQLMKLMNRHGVAWTKAYAMKRAKKSSEGQTAKPTAGEAVVGALDQDDWDAQVAPMPVSGAQTVSLLEAAVLKQIAKQPYSEVPQAAIAMGEAIDELKGEPITFPILCTDARGVATRRFEQGHIYQLSTVGE